VRAAIGASPGRLLRQLLTENLLLSLLAGALALLLANPLASRIGSYFARPSVWGYNVPREVSMDMRVFLFAVGISVIAGLLTGIVPAVRGSRRNLVEELKEGGERSAGDRKAPGRRRIPGMRNLMVSAQMAVAVILAILSGLVLRTLDSVRGIDPGFDVDRTVASFMSTSSSGVTVEERQGFYRELALRFEELSWVRAATVAAQAPLSPHGQRELRIDGQGEPVSVTSAQVVPGFFETVGIELGDGRFFALGDTSGTPDVVVINRTMERRYFGGSSALWRRIWLPGPEGEPDRGFEVVGVVEDAKVRDFLADQEPVVYFSYPQHYYTPGNALILSTTIDPRAAVPLLEQELRTVDPTLVLVNALPYTEVVRGFQFIQRRNAEMFTTVALLGLALAATGLFSVMSLTVGQRTREIGIRMAIGARRREIVRSVVGRALVAVAVGVGAGLGISFVTARMIRSILFGVEPVDPVSIGASTLVLLVAAFLASYLPALRALRVDPVISLKAE
jgi:predicted permease